MLTTISPTSDSRAIEPLLEANPAVVRGFRRAADDALAVGPLSLATRDRLIARGVRLGIKRFDANLILATVEHRRRRIASLRSVRPASPDIRPAMPRWLAWSTVAAVQSMIAAGLWWVIR